MLEFDPVTQDPIITDPESLPTMSPALFYSSGQKVLGTMFLAGGKEPCPTVLLQNGYPGNVTNYDIAHMLQRHRLNVFTFFPRGSWGSKGEYSWGNLVEDCKAAIEFLKSDPCKEKFHTDGSKIILVGHSMGGFSVLYNSLSSEIKNICALAPFNIGMFGHMIDAFEQVRELTTQKIAKSMDFVESTSTNKLISEMTEHKLSWDLLNGVNVLRNKNLLLVGARFDNTAPVDMHHKPLVEALKKAGAGNLQEYILESGHSFTNKRFELMRIISDWIYKITF
jgi:uncharacterized protein